MKFFIDTAQLSEISQALDWGCVSGVTTNPTLYARTGGDISAFPEHMKAICRMCEGMPVSVETVAADADGMVADGLRLAAIADNVVVKLPVSEAGLSACHRLARQGVRTNMTLVFSALQALLAAASGARYVSPFIGRIDDIGQDGAEQLASVVECLRKGACEGANPDGRVEVIAASVRSVEHVTQAALAGADIVTVPFAVLKKCLVHPLTTQGIASFEADWKKVESA